MKNIKSEKTIEKEPMTNDFSVTPDPIIQQLDKSDVACTSSPLAPAFCPPGLKIPSTKNHTAVVSTNYPLSKIDSSSSDVEVKDYTPLVLSSDECSENFVDLSSPTISSYENLLRTPTPPEVAAIPKEILQILSTYNSNLATPVAVKAVPPRSDLLKYERENIQDAGNKENWWENSRGSIHFRN
ncbi:Spindle and kinetochore-associated protein 3 [Sciurus carolinensis]|uniref:Spindle and kinetochore-associated protein 3 n=1 Tax=Sciurus carolinensis TaxID=30640 RepID=A0AA41T8J1_SCICA|nr:Spindle and kinetochore-associated protein 3 [Sciurus carolinensis]